MKVRNFPKLSAPKILVGHVQHVYLNEGDVGNIPLKLLQITSQLT